LAGAFAAATSVVLDKTVYATAGTIINRTAVQLGLSSTLASSMSDPFASTDQSFVLLCELLNSFGEDVTSRHEWAHLIREATATTSASNTIYTMPSDFDRLIDQSEWNQSTRLPLIGPLSGQETQYLKARLNGVLIQVVYRLQGHTMTFAIAPPNAQLLQLEYVSRNWVWSAAGVAPDSTGVVATGDFVLFEDDLAIAGLKARWLEEKGFDSTAAADRFEDILRASITRNAAAKTVTLGGSGINADHLIDASNLPVTGYAQ
jgi:hypothetical protein